MLLTQAERAWLAIKIIVQEFFSAYTLAECLDKRFAMKLYACTVYRSGCQGTSREFTGRKIVAGVCVARTCLFNKHVF